MARENQTIKGAIFIISSCFIFCVTGCLLKMGKESINPATMTFYRFVIGLGLLATAGMLGKIKLRFNDRMGLFLRGLTGGIAIYIAVIVITRIGLYKGVILVFTFPIFSAIFGWLYLKERIRLIEITAILIALGGVILVAGNDAEGSGSASFGRYELLALLGAAIAGIAITLVRKLHDTDDSYAIYFSQCLVGMWLLFYPATAAKDHLDMNGILILLGIGITATIGQLFMTQGFKYVPAKTGSLLCMMDPILNGIAGILLFNEAFNNKTIIGSAMVIVSCGLVILFRENGKSTQQDNDNQKVSDI